MTDSLVQSLTEWLGGAVPAELIIFLVSLLPVLELRGGLVAASLLNVPLGPAFLICYVANMLPIPFILLFIRKIIQYLKTTRLLHGFAEWLERKSEKNRAKVTRYETLGLLLFVAIPLPGTGAWTGALVAAMLDIRMKKSLPVIALGVLIAGVIMTLLSYGLPALLSW
ncbi:MAG: small multi-drug export protein [Clostridiales bacterium]|nr:small multi-drug export protein [Clostridiales bacterium]